LAAPLMFVCLFVCSILILLSQESDCTARFWPNPHSLRSCPFSKFFGCFFAVA